MARNRMIMPEFWTSEKIVECSTTARLLFIGMWNFCDDGGVMPYSLKMIKMQIFPGDDFKLDLIDKWIGELIKNELLIAYEVNGRAYLQVTGWHHQRIERPSFKHPKFDDQSTTIRRPLDDLSTTARPEEKLKEVKRKEIKHMSDCEIEEAWKIYPRKENKQAAIRAWNKLNGDRPEISTLITAIEKQKATIWKDKDIKYVPHMSSWINGQRWNDEITDKNDDYYKNWKIE